MQKWWSLLFGGVMTAAVLLFVVAGAFPKLNWWLPKDVSTFGHRVDNLFYIILIITGFFFILTEGLLVYFMYTYAGQPGPSPHVVGHHYSEKKVFWTSFFKQIAKPVTTVIHNQHRLELAWTFVPAVILLWIAFAQIGAWEEIKYHSRMPKPGQQVQQIEVSARQFEWRIRYPSQQRANTWSDVKEAQTFSDVPHADDLHVVNEVHTWVGQKVLVHLKTRDVIHSFYLPNLRLKQDALPGKTIPVWFEVKEANTRKEGNRWVDGVRFEPSGSAVQDPAHIWELACAELCAWGHYKMLGRLYVHQDQHDFEDWLESVRQEQYRTQPAEVTKTAAR